jgi:hypothetical protein
MDKQAVFDLVSGHLLTQMEKSILPNTSNSCRYRGPSGLMCAAGVLIPDYEYELNMEGMGWDSVVERYPKLSLHGLDSFVADLQQIHDWYPVDFWSERLRHLAKEHNLVCEF